MNHLHQIPQLTDTSSNTNPLFQKKWILYSILAVFLVSSFNVKESNAINGINSVNGLDFPYIELSSHEWNADPLVVLITVDKGLGDQMGQYLDLAINAVDTWSSLLKTYSDNFESWNFEIIGNTDPNGIGDLDYDILLDIRKDRGGNQCNENSGTLGFTADIENTQKPIQSQIFTTCMINNQISIFPLDTVYTTILHEFGHILGLEHAFNSDGDLMCSEEVSDRIINSGYCITDPYLLNEPSDLDIFALIYKYGDDGFQPPNRDLGDMPYYPRDLAQ